MTICAICTVDILGTPARAPLGRNNAMVAICRSCDEDLPVARDHDRGYEPPGSALGTTTKVRRRTRELGQGTSFAANETMQERTAGFVLVRVPIEKGGVTRDQFEAREDFAHKPWASLARHLGVDARNRKPVHLFERPPEIKHKPDTSKALAGLEKFRRKS